MNDNQWDLSRSGPLVVLMSEEVVVTMLIAYNQANQASAVVSRWQIDGEVITQRLTGTNDDWDLFWSRFLDLLPADWQGPVAQSELQVKY